MLRKAQCPACNVIMDVDDLNGASMCNACATPFVTKNGIELYRKSQPGQALEHGIVRADAFLQVQEYSQSKDVYLALSTEYPHDARTWLGVARAISHDATSHSLTDEEFAEVTKYLEKARTINADMVDSYWDAYMENEAARLEREAEKREGYRRKLQREYDEMVQRAKRHLDTLIENKRSMRSTYLVLGIIMLLLSGGIAAVHFLKLLAAPAQVPWLYLMIAGIVVGIGVILIIMGVTSNPHKVSLPEGDIDDIKRTVDRILQSAKRQGVEIDTSQKIKTFVAPNK